MALSSTERRTNGTSHLPFGEKREGRLYGKHILSVAQFSRSDLELIFAVAEDMRSRSIAFDSALQELGSLLHRIALAQEDIVDSPQAETQDQESEQDLDDPGAGLVTQGLKHRMIRSDGGTLAKQGVVGRGA